jgi:hypothetical protein
MVAQLSVVERRAVRQRVNFDAHPARWHYDADAGNICDEMFACFGDCDGRRHLDLDVGLVGEVVDERLDVPHVVACAMRAVGHHRVFPWLLMVASSGAALQTSRRGARFDGTSQNVLQVGLYSDHLFGVWYLFRPKRAFTAEDSVGKPTRPHLRVPLSIQDYRAMNLAGISHTRSAPRSQVPVRRGIHIILRVRLGLLL